MTAPSDTLSPADADAISQAPNHGTNRPKRPAKNIPLPEPIAFEAPFPNRKTIRSWLIPLGGRSTARALLLFAFDYALFAAVLAGVVLASPWWAKVGLGVLAGLIIARLFIIGHDACHQSLTDRRGLNKWLGRLTFLPSLTPYSLWEVGHNVVHHGYTNLKGFDFVWAPYSLEEFRALPRSRRILERIYRNGLGAGLYYLIEIWWFKLFFPSKRQMATRRPIFMWDCALVAAFGALWIGALVWLAVATGQSPLLLVGTGFVLPFLIWNATVGFVLYVHHTHTSVAWYDTKAMWAKAQPFVSTTVHLRFNFGIGAALHHIMEHTAHHVDMSIPLYQLKRAQALLEHALPGRIIIEKFSWRWYFHTARRCKLYDFKALCWTDFRGRQTSENAPTPV
ncbi:MAG: fatty acid desaturase [Burkholderiaceae bacterium]|jgi:acyl-lipid omega-6 desaturase (Delta-12 desaturase)|uniref:Fatty acid desaturase n=1 Tax=Cupriavidus metallidurans TaxID=119219 RepID=A0A132HIE1_9BURK|nr:MULTISPECIES: fatty acid desaturase [Cupriavidus]PCH58525.1 MAG: fatty acid desaturase [Burkholderiaceae bacterium]KWR79700.1 fatty acid desaturase [Cupriavidus sp. SHE]KWW36584.1 Delta(12)-fatty-acid desaturase [Cupriavidus metallidurans]QBP09059.1 fatty acid desaturase [Cupriavidus metallidurans]QWC89489.1 fatty acid desaturase [Cupriavidus metallidurans]